MTNVPLSSQLSFLGERVRNTTLLNWNLEGVAESLDVPQDIRVHEVYHRVELVEVVLDGGTGQDYTAFSGKARHGFGRFNLRVL
jgi:hypothetical protein